MSARKASVLCRDRLITERGVLKSETSHKVASASHTEIIPILKNSVLLFGAANALNSVISAVCALRLLNVRSTFVTVGLVEAAVLMMTAGGMDLSASIFPSKIRQHLFKSGKEWSSSEHKKAEVGAAKYFLAGVLLLIESFAVGII